MTRSGVHFRRSAARYADETAVALTADAPQIPRHVRGAIEELAEFVGVMTVRWPRA